jgi:hypothetical protein
MPSKPSYLLISIVGLLLASCAGPGPFQGNDTGGIIAWSPASQATALDVAMAHCGRYGKYARITSIHAQYGDYIGFACRFPGETVIRSAF